MIEEYRLPIVSCPIVLVHAELHVILWREEVLLGLVGGLLVTVLFHPVGQ